jgi:hypothetical protein
VIVLALPLAGACSRATEGRTERETLYQAESAVTIRLVNNSRLDAAVYLLHVGARERMGTVTASSSGSFPVRGRSFATGEFTLVAEPIGSRRTLTSERLHDVRFVARTIRSDGTALRTLPSFSTSMAVPDSLTAGESRV